MALDDPLDRPWLSADEWCSFQIGQCRLHIHLKKTKEFYASQPKISENCFCEHCNYFESEVINQPNRLFEILRSIEVDLSRQPNINPDSVSCVGEAKPGKLGYMGNYFAFGQIGKTSKKGKTVNEDNSVREVIFNDVEFGPNTSVTIKQVEEDKLSFCFYMDVDKPIEKGYAAKGCVK
jgi:hypothetical protein